MNATVATPQPPAQRLESAAGIQAQDLAAAIKRVLAATEAEELAPRLQPWLDGSPNETAQLERMLHSLFHLSLQPNR